MRVEDFNYDLPEELIAQTPLKDRTSSRLLVLNKNNGEIEHLKFHNIIDMLDENDCLDSLVFRKDYESDKENPNSLLDENKRFIDAIDECENIINEMNEENNLWKE